MIQAQLYLLVYGINDYERIVADKIATTWQEQASKFLEESIEAKIETIDVARWGNFDTNSPCIVFGLANNFVKTDPILTCKLPSLCNLISSTKNLTHRQAALIAIAEAAKAYAKDYKVQNEDKYKMHVELEDGTTAGNTDTNIIITEAEIEYWTRLRDLLCGTAIIIEKGNTKIRIEYAKPK